jgi:glutamine amidotransferase-like uncharacterized protein
MQKRILFSAALITLASILSSCGSKESSSTILQVGNGRGPLVTHQIDALIYDGVSSATGAPEAIVDILESRGLTYETVGASELDRMSIEDLTKFGVLVWPGGYAGQMSSALSSQTRKNIQAAVQARGVSFVGFCAGAFIAVSPDTSWGFSLVKQKTLDYYHLELEGTTDAMVNVEFSDGSSRSLVWWGGPYLPEFPGGVIARYSDNGQPAIAQTWAGRGLVILAGPHPEAPQNWRTKLGLSDPDGLDQETAGQMLEAAITRVPMNSQ